jgi:tRNA-2-methylthio-N6-dimethylallyladenosine synthase
MIRKSPKLKNIKFHVHTFGCQMNENDSERIAGILKSEGGNPSDTPENSQIIIVNTCAVREKSVEKLYSLLGRWANMKDKKDLIIGVAGCVAQLYRAELMDKRSFIDFVVGPDNYNKIPRILLNIGKEKSIATGWDREWNEIPHAMTFRKSTISSYVTIMEGCNNFCSYCIVPFTRGREKYRPMDKIVDEAVCLAHEGYKEIQLLGQNVNTYLDPQTKQGFVSLLTKINKIKGIEWIRFITSHPKNFSREYAETMRNLDKVCRQLHLPIQSGSNVVLARMNRDYTREEYLEKIAILREAMPDISLSTDIIVGFPGETEEDHQDTLDILRTIRFTNIFSFRYSPRPRTAAARVLEDDVPLEKKKRRLSEVQKLQKDIQLEMNESQLGKKMKVLCTGKSKRDPSYFSGRNEGFQVVNFESGDDCTDQFIEVTITGYGPYSLKGKSVRD